MCHLVVDRLFHQRLSNSLNDAAMQLAFDDVGIDEPARIIDRDIAQQFDPGGIGLDFRDADMGAEAADEVGRLENDRGLQTGRHPRRQINGTGKGTVGDIGK